MSPQISTVFAGENIPAKIFTEAGIKDVVVRVRQMPARHHLGYLSVAQDEAQAIEFVCTNIPGGEPLPEGWVDQLTDESHLLLAEKVKELNFLRATATLERNAAVAVALIPFVEKAKASTV